MSIVTDIDAEIHLVHVSTHNCTEKARLADDAYQVEPTALNAARAEYERGAIWAHQQARQRLERIRRSVIEHTVGGS